MIRCLEICSSVVSDLVGCGCTVCSTIKYVEELQAAASNCEKILSSFKDYLADLASPGIIVFVLLTTPSTASR